MPFETILEGIKDDTGITNLRNYLPKIRRLIYRAEKDLGFGGTAILKKIKYKTEDGSIVVTETASQTIYKVRLPEDIISIHEVGSCHEGLCPGSYNIQGRYLFLCEPKDEFSLVYYTLLCDGNGNPVVTENHAEAVVSGVSYWLYKPLYRNQKGSRNVFKDLEQYYFDRIGEAIGDDVMPNGPKEWSKLAGLFNMSSRDILLYSEKTQCFDCLPEGDSSSGGGGTPGNPSNESVYYWQFDDLTTDISFAPNITQEFLDLQNFLPIQNFLSGYLVDYTTVGRIAFAISNTFEDAFAIYDALNVEITDIVFDKYFNTELNTQIYISKEYYTFSTIYFKLIPKS